MPGEILPALTNSGERDLLLITSGPHNSRHGSGVTLGFDFSPWRGRWVHIWLGGLVHGVSDVPESLLLAPTNIGARSSWRLVRKIKGVGRFLRNMLASIETTAGGKSLVGGKIAKFLNEWNCRPKAAYVCVLQDEDARRALYVLDLLDLPYVADVKDVDGTPIENSPYFQKLLAGAKHTYAITPALVRKLAPYCAEISLKLPNVAAVSEMPVPQEGAVLKIVSVGRPFAYAYRCMDEAKSASPCVTEHSYFGPYGDKVPNDLRAKITDRGFAPDDATLRAAMTEFNLAFIDGPLDDLAFAENSFPGRTSFFLSVGLPCIAAVPRGAPVREVLCDCSAVKFCATPAEMQEALLAWSDPAARAEAGLVAIETARRLFGLERGREAIYEQLRKLLPKSQEKSTSSASR